MAYTDSDDFNYGAGPTALASASAAKWAKLTNYADIIMTANQLLGTAGIESAAEIASWGGDTSDQYSECVFTNVNPYGGPTVRSNGVDSYYTFDARAAAQGGSQLYRVVNGTYTALPNAAPSSALVAGNLVRIEIQGTILVGMIQGVAICTYDLTTIVADTGVSALGVGVPGIRFFGADMRIDDWAGGDFSVSGGTASTVPLRDARHQYQHILVR